MTIKEFCEQYNKVETNVRAKIAHNKEQLKDHITKSPYTRTITLDDFAVSFLLEDRRNKNGSYKGSEGIVSDKQPINPISVKETPDTFQHWSDEKKQKVMEICLEEVKHYHYKLSYIPDSFKNAELCQRAVESQGLALQYVPKRLITEELCNIAVNENSIALAFVPDQFKTMKMIKIVFDNYKDARKRVNGHMTMDEMDIDSHLLRYVPEKFRTRSICLMAVSKFKSNAAYIPSEYLNDEDIIAEIIKAPESRKYIPINYWTKDKIIATLKIDKQSKYSDSFGLNGFPKECFSYNLYLEFIKAKLINPQDIYGNEYYSSILTKNEIENIRQIEIDEYNRLNELYRLITEDSNNIRLMSVDEPKYGIYSLTAVCKCGKALKYIPVERRTYEMCRAAIEDDPDAMLYVPDEYKQQIIDDIRKRNDWIKYIFDDGYLSDLFIK